LRAYKEAVVIVVTAPASPATAAAATAHLLDAALRHHLVAVAVVEAHIVCAVAIVAPNLASVVLRAALAASFDLVAQGEAIIILLTSTAGPCSACAAMVN
jgi:hypothetical protein